MWILTALIGNVSKSQSPGYNLDYSLWESLRGARCVCEHVMNPRMSAWSVGQKIISTCCGRKRQTCCLTPVVKEAVKLKGKSFYVYYFFLSCLFVGWLVGFLAVLHKNYRFSTDFLKTWTRNCISPELTLLTFSADLEKEVPGIYLLLLIHAPMKLRVTMCYMLLHIYPGVLEVLVESLALSETQRAERSLVCSGLCLCFLPIM